MAGVSSESLAAALAALEAKLPTASLQLAKELFGILGTVDSSAGLRRALTDPSRSGDEKSALVKQLFSGKVSADAVEIASGLAGSRWASARDIGDALEKKGFNVDRRKIQLHEPLKTLGEFTVPVKLHKDVTAHLKVVIEKEAAE